MPPHAPSSEAPDKARVIDGRAIAAQIQRELAQRVVELNQRGVQPGLAFVRVGEDPASKVYVGRKEKTCAELGIFSETHVLPESASEGELLALLERLNADSRLHGILVQAPLPKQIREAIIYSAVLPQKDVDGFHPVNVGKLMLGDLTGFQPCTPAGIRELLVRSEVKTDGAEVVILGRGNIVGKPMAAHAVPESQRRECDRDDLPFRHARHPGALPPRGHFDRRDGRRRICKGRHGQARRNGD